MTACRCAAPKIPPPARNGAAIGIPSAFAPPASDSSILIVGGGPAGLECATTLARRGYAVTIADSARGIRRPVAVRDAPARAQDLGPRGRLALGTAARAAERQHVSRKRAGGGRHPGARAPPRRHRHRRALDRDVVFDPGVSGRRARTGRRSTRPTTLRRASCRRAPSSCSISTITTWAAPSREQLATPDGDVTYVTTAGNASAWTFMTNELPLVHRALGKAGVPIHTLQRVTGFDGEAADDRGCLHRRAKSAWPAGRWSSSACASRSDDLYHSLIARGAELERAGIAGVTRIGDALAPGAIVHAVHSGHRYAREFDATPAPAPYVRDLSPMNAALLERTLPSSWYRSTEVYRAEKERIFCREWIAVCREEELPNPGDSPGARRARREHLAGAQSRGQSAGVLQCVPASRLAPLQDAGETAALRVALPGGITAGRLIVCPYHQWSYDFNGALVAAPHLSSASGFKKQDFHLYPVGVDALGRIRFLESDSGRGQTVRRPVGRHPGSAAALSAAGSGASAPPFATKSRRIGRSFARTTTSATTAPECTRSSARWCPRSARPAAAIWIGTAESRTAKAPTRSRTAEPRARRAFPGLDADEQVRHKGELVYPNLFLSVACDHVAAFILQPRGAERTDITCHFLFETHEIDEAGLRSVGCGGFLGSGQPPGLGGMRGRAEWNSVARPRPRLLCAHGRLEPGHHGAM